MHNIEEKQGYKFTEEFGYIPEDWNFLPIGTLIESNRLGGNYTNSFSENDFPLIKMGNLDRGKINLDKLEYIQDKEINNNDKLEYGDLLFNTRNTPELVGKVAIWQNELPLAYYNSNLMNLKFKTSLISSNFFVNYILNTKNMIFLLKNIAIGTTSVAAIYNRDLYKLSIPVPPLPEQEKIAEVLSDIDELIESTQKLIDKKKDLKTATMQKLLTPKENWENRILGDLGVTYTGLSGKTKQDFETGNAYYITFLNIMNNISVNTNTFEKVNIKPTESQCLCKKNDIFFNTSSETPEEVGMCSVLMNEIENLYLNSFCFGFRLRKNNEVDSLFLVYLFRSKFGRELMMRLAQGSTRYNLSKDNFIQSTIKIPKYEEQKKSAHLLFDMDAEIEALEKELNKYKDLKTGMMQELLTGKKRLLNNPNKVELFNVKKMSTPANKKVANDEFKDAIIISMLAYKFGSNQYPLGAFRRQKLSYLFKRHNNLPIDEYLKKAMGPYNPQMKYSGGEGIAIRNKYVKEVKQRGLIASSEIAKAKTYFDKYYSKDSLLWLEQNFRYKSNNELEVLATIDYTILDLKAQNKEITLANIKEYINNNAEWKPKLEKPFFTDSAIIKAIQESKNLLNSH